MLLSFKMHVVGLYPSACYLAYLKVNTHTHEATCSKLVFLHTQQFYVGKECFSYVPLWYCPDNCFFAYLNNTILFCELFNGLCTLGSWRRHVQFDNTVGFSSKNVWTFASIFEFENQFWPKPFLLANKWQDIQCMFPKVWQNVCWSLNCFIPYQIR